MKRTPTKNPREMLLQSLAHWTSERAEAIANGDDLWRLIAERCRAQTLAELEKLRTR